MKLKTLRIKAFLISAVFAVMMSVPLAAYAENDYYDYSDTESSMQSDGMTSEDWLELQSEAQAAINSQNDGNNSSPSQKDKNNPKGGSFKDFKEGGYVGSGEWLLVIGIIFIVLGAAGIGFIVFMMVRRKKLAYAKAAKKSVPPAKREKKNDDPEDLGLFLAEFNSSTRPYNGNGHSGRRIAPKSDR